MVAISPFSLAALFVGMICHTAAVPVLDPTQNSAQNVIAVTPAVSTSSQPTPAHTAVLGFAQARRADGLSVPSTARQEPLVLVDMPSQPSEAAGTIPVQELQLVALVNAARTADGEQSLSLNPMLSRIALEHCQDMCQRGYFDHYAPAPAPRTPMDRYVAACSSMPNYAMVGENIFYRSETDSEAVYAAQAHDAFMHSAGHRANILTPEYTQIGVGIYKNPVTGEYWVTEMFLRDTPPSG
jgi:uncharacterized protein YkwD